MEKRRSQIIDIENYLTNISKYIGEIRFIENIQEQGKSLRFILVHLTREREDFDAFAYKIRKFIRGYPDYIDFNYRGLNLYESLSQINELVLVSSKEITENEFNDLKSKINKVKDLFEGIELVIEKEVFHNKLNAELSEVENTVKDIQAAKEILDGIKTEEIYSMASAKYLKFVRIYDGCSYLILLAILCMGIYVYIAYPLDDAKILNFFLSKLLIITTLISLAAIFLRRASHLRKLHDQANQTSLELQALPLYLRNVDKLEHSEIYKILAEKYFGKEFDQTQTDKVGDLLQDQVKSSIELVKASVEIMKKNNSKPVN